MTNSDSEEKKATVTYHDLDHVFGIWDDNEFVQIQDKIDSESEIDAELWG